MSSRRELSVFLPTVKVKSSTFYLEERVDKAFRLDSVPSEAPEKIADFASASGDCRLALKCLMKAGRKADYEGVSSVELKQIESVIEDGRSQQRN